MKIVIIVLLFIWFYLAKGDTIQMECEAIPPQSTLYDMDNIERITMSGSTWMDDELNDDVKSYPDRIRTIELYACSQEHFQNLKTILDAHPNVQTIVLIDMGLKTFNTSSIGNGRHLRNLILSNNTEFEAFVGPIQTGITYIVIENVDLTPEKVQNICEKFQDLQKVNHIVCSARNMIKSDEHSSANTLHNKIALIFGLIIFRLNFLEML